MDTLFDSILNSQVSMFKQAVMKDYWEYSHKPIEKNGFSCLGMVSPEYLLQSYFNKRLEEYVRRYLVNDFLLRVLESRGHGIYLCSLPENCDVQKFYSIKEYEQLVMYEFIVDSAISNKRIGVRYTELSSEKNYDISDDVDEIHIISWDDFNTNSIHKKEKKVLKNGKQLITESIYDFMKENSFTEKEYNKYVETLICVVIEVQELLGVRSIPKLNPYLLFQFRFEIEDTLKEYVKKIFNYNSTENKLLEIAPESVNDFNWAYQIIDIDNKNRYPNLETQSKELLKEALGVFVDKKYYQALIGKSDFARSFITSEYLYKQFDCSDQFDYTSIISGYLKSIEQFLYHISLKALNKGIKIKSTGKKLEDNSRAPYKVEYTSDNLNDGYCDTTMGALSYLIKESKKNIIENKKYKGYIFDCLQCFIKECRNDSFHKHNIDQWSRVEKIRNNTIVIMIILFGLCKFGNSQSEIDKKLGIIRNDSMERALYWIASIKSETFKIQFVDENPIEVRISTTSKYPSFDKWGFIKDSMFFLECVKEMDHITKTPKLIIIKKGNIPKKMWCFDKNGNYCLWEI